VINRPNRFVSRKILPIKYSEKGVMNAPFKLTEEWRKKQLYDKLANWYDSIHLMKNMKPSDFIATVRKDLEYDKFIIAYSEANQLDKSQFFDILNEIQDNAEPFEDFDSWMSFVENELVVFKEKMKNKVKEDSVTLSTIHRAKGLEWEHVIILDANEEITPYYKAETEEELEEERRMFYVAATRAKTNLTMYSIEKRNKTQMTVSRFVNEMLHKTKAETKNRENQLQEVTGITQFAKGDWVFHKVFGIGMIMFVNDNEISIAFENEGLKTLTKSWCVTNLQIFN
jgi:DNA helicase-2/ATP-dependent DNA helicase PcrA